MKTLYLIRHAKSDWNNPELKDIERHLNDRGYAAANVMSERLNKTPDLIITSPAIRAISTVGSSRVDLQACKLEYSIVSPK